MNSGNEFEKEYESHFPTIRTKTGAFLFRMYPPIRGTGMRGTMPVFVIVGRALFDVGGWYEVDDDGLKRAVFIGVELKATKQRHPSLPIIGKDSHGSGLQAHQLEALASLHRNGGIAKVVYNNGGVIGVLDGEQIAKVFYDYGVSLAAERMGKKPAMGSRSIRWDMFRSLPNYLDRPDLSIFAPAKAPTVAATAAARRRKARKLIEENERVAREDADADRVIEDVTEEDADLDSGD
jgi:hypothetical protein